MLLFDKKCDNMNVSVKQRYRFHAYQFQFNAWFNRTLIIDMKVCVRVYVRGYDRFSNLCVLSLYCSNDKTSLKKNDYELNAVTAAVAKRHQHIFKYCITDISWWVSLKVTMKNKTVRENITNSINGLETE